MKIGDKVRFLSEVGGGTVRGFQGKDVALVEDESGFEIPMLIRECVVIQTDQYNRPVKETQSAPPIVEEKPITYKLPEIKGNNALNLYLAFVPEEPKAISSTDYDTYIVNDSNYVIDYVYLYRVDAGWKLKYRGRVEPNMKEYIETFGKQNLNDMECLSFHAIAYKEGYTFSLKAPIQRELKIDTTKFYKLHSFTQTDFFDEPALLYTIIKNDNTASTEIDGKALEKALQSKKHIEEQPATSSISKKATPEIIEVDLHIHELLDDTTGMSNKDMLDYQLKTLHETIATYKHKRGQKIVFIHGKGDGVLRKAILDELKKKYNQMQWQDASFREYGFGATMLTIR